MTVGRTAPRRTVRLWWRCRLCGRRFDTFGFERDPPAVRAAAWEALDHFDRSHGLHLDDLDEAGALLDPAGRTTRVVRHALLRPFRASS